LAIVHLKNKKNGVTYVYESEGYWDKEKQQSRSRRKCIGKLDPETGELIPSKKYLAEQELEKLKASPGPVPTTESKKLFWGATYLLDSIGEQLGITKDLKLCFPENYEDILSVAYFLALEEANTISRFPKWGRTHFHPSNNELTSQRISELFYDIDENGKQKFFKLQFKRRIENEYLAYDTTSISSYSKLLKQAKRGKNKEHDPLPQINLALVYGQDSRIPVYYRKLPGNINDVTTIKKLLLDMGFLSPKQVKFILDRGFYSEANINDLYTNHYKFLISTKVSLSFVQEHLNPVRDELKTRSCYSPKHRIHYFSKTISWEHTYTKKRSGEVVKSSKRLYLHLYYDEERAVDDRIGFYKRLDQLEEEIKSGKIEPNNIKVCEKYFTVKRTPKRGLKITPNQEAIDNAMKNFGYFTLSSNIIKDALEGLEIYRSKDIIEKAFGNLKERLSMRRMRVHSEECSEGKLFVQYIALIYVAYIDKIMNDHNIYGKFTLQELLDELDVIERFEQPSKRHHVGEITKKQRDLYEIFGIEPPS
jgi:transposase